MRPLLPDDGVTEATVIAYATSTEALGRGIDLIQSGMFSLSPIPMAFHVRIL